MTNALAQTVATYCNPQGAANFVAKEDRNAAQRNAAVWGLAEDWPLQGMKILDVGCGFGRDVAMFRERGAEAYGVDISAPLLAEAQSRFGHAEWWFENDVLTLHRSPVGKLDVVWCINVLVHVPRPQMPALLRRWAGWLKPGGRLVVSSKQGNGESLYLNLGDDLPRVMVLYQPQELTAVLEKSGMVVEQELPPEPQVGGDARVGLVWRKI
jgi:2-polyprenyl-3-methyl-5-hydroxy-6-metoxy-1,4-benzoquinol methylase